MAKFSDITIGIKAKLNIDRRTAETCLRLVENYCNENGVCIMCSRGMKGDVEFEFAQKSSPGISSEALDAINAIGRETHREV